MSSATAAYLDFLEKIRFEQIPKEAIRQAKRSILDCLGVGIAASANPEISRIIIEYLSQIGAAPKSTIIRLGIKTSVPEAAFANGILCHYMDYDDINWVYTGHFSTVVVPAILAMGEAIGANGKEALVAYLASHEITCKIGRAIVENGDHYRRGWHSTGTLGTLSSGLAMAKLMHLNSLQSNNMLGMAVGQASGLKINFGTMAKPFQAGHASRNGVVAAILASNGMTAASNAIEAPRGFCEITSNTYDKTKLNEPLGHSWEILEPNKGVIFKLYPVLGGGMGIIDSVIDLSKKFDISSNDVARVVCTLREEMAASLSQGIPRTPLEGKFNIPFWVATALIEHEVTPSHFTDAQVKDPAVRDLMSKVNVQYSSKLKREDGANIEIILKDGKNYSRRTWPPKGAPDNPPSDADLYAKFIGCAKFGGVDEKEAGIIAKLVMSLETLTDMRDLTKHLK